MDQSLLPGSRIHIQTKYLSQNERHGVKKYIIRTIQTPSAVEDDGIRSKNGTCGGIIGPNYSLTIESTILSVCCVASTDPPPLLAPSISEAVFGNLEEVAHFGHLAIQP